MIGKDLNQSHKNPIVSVIIASYNAAATISECLSSLIRQETGTVFEILVVDSSDDDTEAIIRSRFPQVKLLHVPRRLFCGDARNIGLAHCSGQIIAFIDADCVAAPDWIDRIARTHREDHLAVGGAIDNHRPANIVSWAAYFCEFSRWMPYGGIRPISDMAAANLSFKRQLLERFGPFIEGTYCSDSEFNWRLKDQGISILFVPAILVRHSSIPTLREYIIHEFYHGRSFARVRSGKNRFSDLKNGMYVLLMPAIFVKLLVERLFYGVRHAAYSIHFLKALPLLIPGIFSWSLGEAAGYAGRMMK